MSELYKLFYSKSRLWTKSKVWWKVLLLDANELSKRHSTHSQELWGKPFSLVKLSKKLSFYDRVYLYLGTASVHFYKPPVVLRDLSVQSEKVHKAWKHLNKTNAFLFLWYSLSFFTHQFMFPNKAFTKFPLNVDVPNIALQQ